MIDSKSDLLPANRANGLKALCGSVADICYCPSAKGVRLAGAGPVTNGRFLLLLLFLVDDLCLCFLHSINDDPGLLWLKIPGGIYGGFGLFWEDEIEFTAIDIVEVVWIVLCVNTRLNTHPPRHPFIYIHK